MEVKVFQKFDPKVDRGSVKRCQLCNSEFSLFVREHQCKRCLQAVCQKCGTAKKDVYKPQMMKQAHRLCKVCAKESEYLVEHIKENRLSFGAMSEQGLRWVKKIGKNGQSSNGKKGPSSNQFQMQNSKNSGKLTKEIFKDLWDSYNYSLRELVGLLTFELDQKQVHEKISSVYDKVLRYYPDQKIENLAYLIVFLLCYCDEGNAVEFCLFLLELRRTIAQNKELVNLYLKTLGMSEDEIKKTADYTRSKIKKFSNSLSVNTITAEGSIYLISRLFERRKIDELYIFYALVIQLNKDTLTKSKNSKSQCDLSLIRNCNLEKISENYRKLGHVKTHNFIKTEVPTYQNAKSEVNVDYNHRDSDYMSVKSGRSMNPDFRGMGQPPVNNNMNFSDSPTESSFKKKIYNSEDVVESYSSQGDDEQEITDYSALTASIKKSPQQVPFKTFETTKRGNNNDNESHKRLFEQTREPADCSECKELKQEIKELKNQLSMKNLQIENLEIRIRLQIENKSLNQSDSEVQRLQQEIERVRNQSKSLQGKNVQLQREKSGLQDLIRKSENEKEITDRLRQQVVSLRNQTEELSLTNRMLKNKVEASSMVGSGQRRDGQQNGQANESELGRMNEMLKSSLMEKNEQMETLMKQNKLLTYQLEQFKKNSGKVQKLEEGKLSQDRQIQQLMAKISELSDLLVKEEAEKLRLSEQMFQLKQTTSEMEKTANDRAISTAVHSQKSTECGIF